jgi:hypothetical protein
MLVCHAADWPVPLDAAPRRNTAFMLDAHVRWAELFGSACRTWLPARRAPQRAYSLTSVPLAMAWAGSATC